MKPIKLICTDVDGTLLDINRGLSPYTLQVLKRAMHQHQIPLILASSRMPSAMTYFHEELGINERLICYNGALVLDKKGQNGAADVLFSLPIPSDITSKIIDFGEELALHTSVYKNDNWYAPQMDYWTEREINNTRVQAQIADYKAIKEQVCQKAQGAHKIMCMGSVEHIDQMMEFLYNNFSETVSAYRSKDTYLELANKSINKATAIQLIAIKYDVLLDEIMAFGDNYNDMEMLESVGWGVAVGNGREEVKAIANEITCHHKEDGLAKSLEAMLNRLASNR